MTAKVFRPRVHDDIRPVFEGVLQAGWTERGVDEEECPAGMSLIGVVLDVIGFAGGVYGGFDVDDVAGTEVFGGAVERELSEACEAGVYVEHAMGAVVAASNGYLFWLEVCLHVAECHRKTTSRISIMFSSLGIEV